MFVSLLLLSNINDHKILTNLELFVAFVKELGESALLNCLRVKY